MHIYKTNEIKQKKTISMRQENVHKYVGFFSLLLLLGLLLGASEVEPEGFQIKTFALNKGA
jgi:hypothetical protein